jgi:hypothetical protein
MISETAVQTSAPTPLLPIIYAAVIFLIATLTSPLLNIYMQYTLAGGSLFEKFHPATYVVVSSFILSSILSSKRHREATSDDFSLVYLSLFFLLAVWALVIGNAGYFAVLVDIFVAPMMFVIMIQRLNEKTVEALFNFFVALIVLHTLIVVVEFTRRIAILPYNQSYAFFRPAGLLGHPIAAGAMCAIAMIGSRYTVHSFVVRRLVLLALMAQIAMCGVRAALAIGVLVFVLDIVRPYGHKRTIFNLSFDYVTALIATIGVVILVQVGVFDRVLAVGFWDDSADSRFEIFQILDFMSEDEFWFGTTYERGLYYASVLDNKRIESSFVIAIYQCGIAFAVSLFTVIVLSFFNTIRRSLLFGFLLAFLTFTTIFFGVKNTTTYGLFFLSSIILMKSRERPQEDLRLLT